MLELSSKDIGTRIIQSDSLRKNSTEGQKKGVCRKWGTQKWMDWDIDYPVPRRNEKMITVVRESKVSYAVGGRIQKLPPHNWWRHRRHWNLRVCERGGGLRAFESGVCEKRDFSVSSCFCAWVGAEATSDSNSKGCLKKLNRRFLDLNLNLVPEPLKFEFLPEDFCVDGVVT